MPEATNPATTVSTAVQQNRHLHSNPLDRVDLVLRAHLRNLRIDPRLRQHRPTVASKALNPP